MIRILHTISSLGALSGGTSSCTYNLVKALNQVGCTSDILTIKSRDIKNHIIGDDAFIRAVDYDAWLPLRISNNFRMALSQSNYDVYHSNGLWLDTNHATARIALLKNKPYIISTHGMLYPQALARSFWKKKLMLMLGHKKDIARATCIHATCIQEKEHYRQLGFTNPVAIIPNPVEIPHYISSIHRSETERFRIGFLGRIHPIKRIHDLISAWAKLGNRVADGELVIVGQGNCIYMKQLLDQVEKLNLHNVKFLGFLSGREKYKILSSFNALFVPSEFENFGMIVPEALIMETPVMASFGTPWGELNTHQCGWWRNNDVDTLATCLEEVISLSSDELRAMGRRGKELVLQNYSSCIVASKMKNLYEYLINRGSCPDFLCYE